MAYTLLKTVQMVLSDMNEDKVSSLYGSDEALEVANLAVSVYSAILTEYPWVIKESIINPVRIDRTTITVPSTSQRVKVVRYAPSGKCGGDCDSKLYDPGWTKQSEWTPSCNWNKCGVPQTYLTTNYVPKAQNHEDGCVELTFLPMEEFLNKCHYHDSDCCTVCSMSGDHDDEYKIKILNDKDPEYWTEIGGKVVLDSYCSNDGTKLHPDRLMMIGMTSRELEVKDSTVIDLTPEFYNYFLAELKSTAFYTLQERPNEKEEQRAQRLRKSLLRANGLQGRSRTKIGFDYGATWRGR